MSAGQAPKDGLPPVSPDGVYRSVWPDFKAEAPLKQGKRPPKTDDERRIDQLRSWGIALDSDGIPIKDLDGKTALTEVAGSPQTKLESGDGRKKIAPFNGKPRQKYASATPNEDGSNPVDYFGPVTRHTPKMWGPHQGAYFAREYEVSQTVKVAKDGKTPLAKETRTLATKIMRHRRFDLTAKDPATGKLGRWVDCSEDKAEKSIHVGWAGGAQTISTKRGDQIVYPASDKLPCRGTGERAKIIRSTEERDGKNGPYKVDLFRATCPTCGQVRDVPHKVAKAEPRVEVWDFPSHAQPRTAKASGYQSHGEIVPLTVERKDRAGDKIVASISHVDPDEIIAWIPTPDRPERDGHMVALAMGEAAASDRQSVRGFSRMLRIFRDGADMSAPLYYTSEKGVKGIVLKRGEIVPTTGEKRILDPKNAAERAKNAAITMVGSRPVADGSIKGQIAVSDLETYALKKADRVHRAISHPVLCDAKKAPPRNLDLALAF